jgi:hypothetical protein
MERTGQPHIRWAGSARSTGPHAGPSPPTCSARRTVRGFGPRHDQRSHRSASRMAFGAWLHPHRRRSSTRDSRKILYTRGRHRMRANSSRGIVVVACSRTCDTATGPLIGQLVDARGCRMDLRAGRAATNCLEESGKIARRDPAPCLAEKESPPRAPPQPASATIMTE